VVGWAGNYQRGRPYAQCDRCDRKCRLDELKAEWSGVTVCPRCWDPKPEHLTAPRIDATEGAPLPDARPAPVIEASDEDLAFPYRDGTTFDPDNPTDLGG
jgi:hypothetical protein